MHHVNIHVAVVGHIFGISTVGLVVLEKSQMSGQSPTLGLRIISVGG